MLGCFLPRHQVVAISALFATLAVLYFSLEEKSMALSTQSYVLPVIAIESITTRDYGISNALEIRRQISLFEGDGEEESSSTLVLQLSRPEENSSNSSAVTSNDGDDVVSLVGRHMIHLSIGSGDDPMNTRKECPFPRFGVRFVGPTLVGVRMTEIGMNVWSGSFDLPAEGTYRLDMRWYECDEYIIDNDNEGTAWRNPINEEHAVSFRAVETNNTRTISSYSAVESDSKLPVSKYYLDNEQLFAQDSAWWNTSLVESLNSDDIDEGRDLPAFMWMSPTNAVLNYKKSALLQAPNSVVSTEGTLVHPDDYYAFGNLGNYELVCFLGSNTSAATRQAFMKLKNTVRPGQRSFKFQYHCINSYLHPDSDWMDDAKKQFRKCKHILVSIDEPKESISQSMYREQVTAFIGHLVRNFDETFPIWLYSILEPPMKATNCHSPTMMRTTDHPCNDVLKDLFHPMAGDSSIFPPQVHFLDNTDLTMPQFGENHDDVLAVVALRTFVLIGKGVTDWRKIKQKGEIDGLHRNGTIEPHSELVPITGW